MCRGGIGCIGRVHDSSTMCSLIVSSDELSEVLFEIIVASGQCFLYNNLAQVNASISIRIGLVLLAGSRKTHHHYTMHGPEWTSKHIVDVRQGRLRRMGDVRTNAKTSMIGR
jgi:hypothetical protein